MLFDITPKMDGMGIFCTRRCKMLLYIPKLAHRNYFYFVPNHAALADPNHIRHLFRRVIVKELFILRR